MADPVMPAEDPAKKRNPVMPPGGKKRNPVMPPEKTEKTE